MNRRKTSNTQHPTSNNQWFPIGPLIGGWVLDVRCSQGFMGRKNARPQEQISTSPYMSIEVATEIRVLGQEEFHALDRRLMAVVFAVHNEFGRFLDEALYTAFAFTAITSARSS